MEVSRIKCVIVGDDSIGKTSLLMTFSNKEFPKIVPPVFDNPNIKMIHENQRFLLEIFDTVRQEGFNTLRPLIYPNTHVVIVAFSLVDENSFLNVKEKWFPELKYHKLGGVTKIIVGTKSDLTRDEKHIKFMQEREMKKISTNDLEKMSLELKSIYFICSSKSNEGLDEIFNAVLRLGLIYKENSNNSCEIL